VPVAGERQPCAPPAGNPNQPQRVAQWLDPWRSPTRRKRLSAAAVKRRVGQERELTERFLALVSHYLFEPCFARPGEGHDKGGVEARGKGIRLQHLTPIPQGESLAAVAQAVQAELDRAFAAQVDAEGIRASERLAQESRQGLPLPAVPFAAHRVELVTVSRGSLVRAGGAQYSVPSSWASLEATAYVGVETVRVVCGGEQVDLPRASGPASGALPTLPAGAGQEAAGRAPGGSGAGRRAGRALWDRLDVQPQFPRDRPLARSALAKSPNRPPDTFLDHWLLRGAFRHHGKHPYFALAVHPCSLLRSQEGGKIS
jgi:hypothetical protein